MVFCPWLLQKSCHSKCINNWLATLLFVPCHKTYLSLLSEARELRMTRLASELSSWRCFVGKRLLSYLGLLSINWIDTDWLPLMQCCQSLIGIKWSNKVQNWWYWSMLSIWDEKKEDIRHTHTPKNWELTEEAKRNNVLSIL